MNEPGDIKVFNPNKEISKEITLEILMRHRDAMKQARIGEVIGSTMEQIADNTRKFNQVRALNLIISSQREMITISRPIIFFRSMQVWKKKYKEDEQEENPFDKHDNDYNNMKRWLDFLKFCQGEIISADKTKKLEDDFIIVKDTSEGDKAELTENFYDMLEELESSYEQIYLLMLTNKIVSAGIEEDEELSYKEKEKEASNRIEDA